MSYALKSKAYHTTAVAHVDISILPIRKLKRTIYSVGMHMSIKIDPDQDLMLSKISWPLALRIIGSSELAYYSHYEELEGETHKRRYIYYTFQQKLFKLLYVCEK